MSIEVSQAVAFILLALGIAVLSLCFQVLSSRQRVHEKRIDRYTRLADGISDTNISRIAPLSRADVMSDKDVLESIISRGGCNTETSQFMSCDDCPMCLRTIRGERLYENVGSCCSVHGPDDSYNGAVAMLKKHEDSKDLTARKKELSKEEGS
jgi:hypothetical protein